MFRSLITKLRKFSNDDGMVAAEFGIVAVPFVSLVIAIFQTFMVQVYTSYFDRAVQRFASELRSGAKMVWDAKTQAQLQDAVKAGVCLQIKPLAGLNCDKLQVQLFKVNCRANTTDTCWSAHYTDFPRAIRKKYTYLQSAPVFDFGVVGDSQYMVVFYPMALMSPIWDTSTALLSDGTKARGLLSTAMWINDPSVAIFSPTP